MLSVKSLGLPANWPEMLVILPQLSANLPGSITDLFERLVNFHSGSQMVLRLSELSASLPKLICLQTHLKLARVVCQLVLVVGKMA